MSSSCKICFDSSNSSDNPLINPCNCKGTIEYIHKECLEKWIQLSKNHNCSVCLIPYRLQYNYSSPLKNILITTKLFAYIYFPLHFIFYIVHPNTYDYSSMNTINRIIFSMTTTYIHFFNLIIHLGIIFIILLLVFGLVITIIQLINGNFESDTNNLINSEDIKKIGEIIDEGIIMLEPLTYQNNILIYLGFSIITFSSLFIIHKYCVKKALHIRV